MTAGYASVDLDGTNIKCAYGDESGQIVCSDGTPTQPKVRSHILERPRTGGCPCVESGDRL